MPSPQHDPITTWLAPSACMQLRSCACQRCSIVPEAVVWDKPGCCCCALCSGAGHGKSEDMTPVSHTRRCGSSSPCKPQALRPSQPSWAQPACINSTAEIASLFHYSASAFLTSLLDKDTHAGMGDTLSDSNCDCVYDGRTQIHV